MENDFVFSLSYFVLVIAKFDSLQISHCRDYWTRTKYLTYAIEKFQYE